MSKTTSSGTCTDGHGSFVDRDMMMRYLGLGVGHLNPRDFPHEVHQLANMPDSEGVDTEGAFSSEDVEDTLDDADNSDAADSVDSFVALTE